MMGLYIEWVHNVPLSLQMKTHCGMFVTNIMCVTIVVVDNEQKFVHYYHLPCSLESNKYSDCTFTITY